MNKYTHWAINSYCNTVLIGLLLHCLHCWLFCLLPMPIVLPIQLPIVLSIA